jgi:aryl-alcohol dehydrogenase-like predicted oxidoreductase
MQMRALGRSGIEIAPLMFGGNVFGWTADETMSHRLMDAFLDHGFNAVDTADVYSTWAPGHVGGESETVLGSWLASRGRRERVVVATKLGMLAPNNGLRRGQIETAVEASLRRLRTDYIDLYQAHRDDEETPLEETLEAFDALKKAGKIRAVGASNYAAPRLKAALDASAARGLARFESLQPEYSLAVRDRFEGPLQALCVAEDVGVITYSSLAGGFLTGKYRSEADLGKSPRGRGALARLNERGLKILAALDDTAAAKGAPVAAVALAWLIAQKGVTAAIASATSLEQLTPLLEGALLDLDAGELDALTAASA